MARYDYLIRYQNAVDFCKWLSVKDGKQYRLPTEAEWEYACRAGTYTLYYTGDGLPASMCRNQVVARDYKPVSLRVGQTEPNSFGLYDMHGLGVLILFIFTLSRSSEDNEYGPKRDLKY
jgi:formylglycine-generating enzyme